MIHSDSPPITLLRAGIEGLGVSYVGNPTPPVCQVHLDDSNSNPQMNNDELSVVPEPYGLSRHGSFVQLYRVSYLKEEKDRNIFDANRLWKDSRVL